VPLLPRPVRPSSIRRLLLPFVAVCGYAGVASAQASPERGTSARGPDAAVELPAVPPPSARIDPEAAPRPFARATRIAQPVRVDGRLDEAQWAQAEPLTDFVQQLPETGMPATFRTEVRILYDDEHLWIGGWNFDPEPRKAITSGLERDFDSAASDIFGVSLDTFHDLRNSFLFVVNPHGALLDEQTFDDSRNVVREWEGIVTVRTTFGDSAWFVEMEIPLKTLRFDASRPVQEWGLNIIRRVRRVNETSYWAPLDRQNRLHRMSRAGTLAGLEGLRQGRNLWIKPYVVGGRAGGVDVAAASRGLRGDAGLDVKYGVTPSLTADFTLNTDFSQVEVDQEQVNLTRFSLFFPERREFFIENSGVFTFGDVTERNYRMGASLGDFVLFNSRQIGLTADRRPLPVGGGGRLSGRVGDWEVGLLDMQTQADLGTPAENFGVARVRRRFAGASDVGVLAANRQATDGSGRWNRSYGTDANLRAGNLIVNAYWAASAASDTGQDGWAARTSVAYRDRFWNTSAMVKRVTDDFAPGIGFVRRTGMQQSFATLGVHARPAWRGIQEVAPYVSGDVIHDLDGQLDTRTVTAGLDLAFQPDGTLGIVARESFDRLEVPFQVNPGTVIPVGAYAWRDVGVEWQTSQARAVSANVAVGTGSFYSGTRRSVGTRLFWRARYDANVELRLQRNDVALPTGNFRADLAGLRVRYAWSTRLFGAAFVQYNSQAGTFSTNARLAWRWAPLSDVFLVYTERQTLETGLRNERTLALKVTRLVAF
jgi:hypothetical protein